MTGVNRSISAPISIQVDQQDTMSLRDCGIIQLYVESSQEAYDTHIAAFKIAEDPQDPAPGDGLHGRLDPDAFLRKDCPGWTRRTWTAFCLPFNRSIFST